MLTKKLARSNNVSGPSIRISMNAAQRTGKFRLIACQQDWFNGFERVQTHPCRTSAREKAIDHFGPQMLVTATGSDLSKLAKPPLNLAAPLPMRPLNILDCYWLSDFLHRFNSEPEGDVCQ